MEYMDVHKASVVWDMTERRITALCRGGRIIGAKKVGKLWLIPDTAPKPLDARTKLYNEREEGYTSDAQGVPPSYEASEAQSAVINAFRNTYRRDPVNTAFTPYRICPLGAHTDHQLGKITGFAIDKGIHIAYGPKNNGIIEIASLQFPKRAQWHVAGTPDQPQNDWADHLRGATIALNNR